VGLYTQIISKFGEFSAFESREDFGQYSCVFSKKMCRTIPASVCFLMKLNSPRMTWAIYLGNKLKCEGTHLSMSPLWKGDRKEETEMGPS
jgi:hypothetical protein